MAGAEADVHGREHRSPSDIQFDMGAKGSNVSVFERLLKESSFSSPPKPVRSDYNFGQGQS